MCVVCALSMLLKIPLKGFVPAAATASKAKASAAENNVASLKMLRSGSFWKLWFYPSYRRRRWVDGYRQCC